MEEFYEGPERSPLNEESSIDELVDALDEAIENARLSAEHLSADIAEARRLKDLVSNRYAADLRAREERGYQRGYDQAAADVMGDRVSLLRKGAIEEDSVVALRKLRDTSLEDIRQALGKRAYGLLERRKCRTVGDMERIVSEDPNSFRGISPRTTRVITAWLRSNGLKTGSLYVLSLPRQRA